MVERVYGHLGRIRHRSEDVRYEMKRGVDHFEGQPEGEPTVLAPGSRGIHLERHAAERLSL